MSPRPGGEPAGKRARRNRGARKHSAARDEHVYGLHAVMRLMQESPESVLALWVSERRDDQRVTALVNEARASGISPQAAEPATLERLSAGGRHQGVVARVRPGAPSGEGELLERIRARPADVLVLDGVSDPHNLGACLRSAAAAGIGAVVVPRANSAPLGATARSVACGGAEVVELYEVANIARTLQALSQAGVQTVGLSGGVAQSVYALDLKPPTAFVMGAEGSGLRRLTRERCEQLVSIPMPGPMESLNLSVATGIVLFECVRQRSTD